MRKSADTAYVEATLDEWVGKNICRELTISSCPPDFPYIPAVRHRLQWEWDAFTTVARNAVSSERMDSADLRLIPGPVAGLDKVHQHWKQAHWKLASPVIGEARGTGYTVGVPYLKEVIANSLFRHRPEAPSPAATQGDRHAPA